MSQKNARIGAIGEHMVAAQLMQQGWDAFNANSSISNMKTFDLICLNEKKEAALIQVKTTIESSFPVGISMEDAKDKKKIEDYVTGPWVFVRSKGEKEKIEYTYYILTRDQVRALIYESNDWYLNHLKRDTPVSTKGTCCVREEWLNGQNSEPKRLEGDIFINPLKGAITKDAWNNIWM